MLVASLLSLCCYVFFKQKTAYELRISDWSSGVCSSVLAQVDERAVIGDVLDHALDDLALGQRLDEAAALFGAGFFQDGAARHDEIGRASCRDSVCQYV